ncbi:phage baseplate protein [Megamonas funiformis]|uniref:phage baseplate protein n=2 Tax=Megamonas funiformis TaxID=437897 RepID=UPI003993EA5A
MAKFDDLTITNNGLDMIALSQSGAKLIFTKIKLGDGQIGDNDVMKLTDIINERMTSQISSIEAKGEGQVAIKFTVDNSELTSGFFVREIGIFAKINEGGEEKLYAYTNAGNYTNYLADNKTPIDAIITKIDLAIGNATDINFTVDKSIIYVSLEDLETNLQKHNSNIDSHTEAFTKHNDDENAHDNLIKKLFDLSEVTLESIKSKIKDWSKEVCLPLSGGTMKGNINASGYNITATKFIGNLQGKADSATKANQDKNGKDITGYLYKTEDLTLNSNAEILTVGNISEILNSFCTKFKQIQGTGTYAENSPTSIKSLNDNKAPKTSPAFSGTPTAPTPGVDTNNTQLATCGFVRNAIAKYAPMLDTMKKIYPVGSIYMSTVSTNPATLFGFGRWEAMPAGRVLLAQGTASWGTYNAGSTGGEATHQLTVGEMPAHSHKATTNTTGNHTHPIPLYTVSGGGPAGGPKYDPNNVINNGTSGSSGNHSHTVTINNSGNNQPHNNLQPYIVVYMWQRVN